MKHILPAFLATFITLTAWLQTPTATTPLTVMTWDVESGGADAVTISGQIAAFAIVDLHARIEAETAPSS